MCTACPVQKKREAANVPSATRRATFFNYFPIELKPQKIMAGPLNGEYRLQKTLLESLIQLIDSTARCLDALTLLFSVAALALAFFLGRRILVALRKELGQVSTGRTSSAKQKN